ncbi:MAG TPA: hypothetical protein VK811_10770 [Candidatus Acidoferrum sp.]|nr:hypothetical protein [Candidatus Acidoferrum sp.]
MQLLTPGRFFVDNIDFVVQSVCMQTNWAEENLQTIRTLMERSAVYRRALAPIMLFAGTLGVVAAIIGLCCHLESWQGFGALWLGTAVIAVVGALLIVRRQAVKESEVFWSPPTKRVGQAILPPLFAGMVLGSVFTFIRLANPMVLTFLWLFFYGCALHAAGFFMQRGMKVFGWIYIGSASVILCILAPFEYTVAVSAHWFMGFFFGVLHLAYGVYLYLTEKEKNAA